jgi:dTDP-glucose pyrophosphorylase
MAMHDLAKIMIAPATPILDAIKSIDAGGIQIAIIADEGGTLLGTVTDGDVRRGLLRGVTLDQPVKSVMNKTPRTLRSGHTREAVVELMRRLTLRQIPIVDADNRVVGVEVIDEVVIPQVAGTWVVLMAGGLGTRLRPLTDNIPKPMIPVGGRPLLETIIRNFESQGFRDIFLSVNYKSDVIRKHFGDGLNLGVSITYLLEEQRLGTAGALALLPKRPSGPVVVMNGDLLTSVNFRQLVEFHRQQRATATMCVREYAFQVPYGVVQTEGPRLKAVVEKPVHNFFVNAGVYVVEPQVLDLFPPGEPMDMPQLFERIAETGDAASVFPIHEYWLDIGRIDDLERAQGDYSRVFK